MKTIYSLLAIFLLTLFTTPLISQDVIYQRNNDTIKCKVKEIGTEVIKYSLPDFPSDLLFSMDKENVKKITFSNGKEMEFKKEMTNPDNYVDNKKNAYKVDFLSPLTGNLTLFYERSRKPGRSIEAALGIIGLGRDVADENPFGFFVKFGPKFIKSPDFYLKGMRYAHVLKGTYVKPEIIIGYFQANRYNWYDSYHSYYNTERRGIVTGAIMLTVGKQWVFDNSFLLDFYFGVGYGIDSDDSYDSYFYSHAGPDGDSPLTFSAGLKMGGLFK